VGFYEIAPCTCCGRRRVPVNRSWPDVVCTPSCWLALPPSKRVAFSAGSGAEDQPCLACQDRIGERSSSLLEVTPTDKAVADDHRAWLAEQAASSRGRASSSVTRGRSVSSRGAALRWRRPGGGQCPSGIPAALISRADSAASARAACAPMSTCWCAPAPTATTARPLPLRSTRSRRWASPPALAGLLRCETQRARPVHALLMGPLEFRSSSRTSWPRS
jgi:hypothetical protein